MNIGILTFHYALNYGAFLQAFAMQYYLEREGHQVEFINYENDYVNLAYKLFRFKAYNKRKLLECVKRILNDMYHVNKYPKYRQCVSDKLRIGNRVQTNTDNNIYKYDCIIIGSDQLWNKEITNGFDYFYCAKFHIRQGQKVVGYSISMNKSRLDEPEIMDYKQIISRFDILSVRESNTVSLLQPLSDKLIRRTIDPTFLLSSNEWLKYVKPVKEKNYICVYPILNQKEVKSRSREYAKILKKKLVIIEPIANSQLFSLDKKPNTPFEFLSLIANADIVLTSSFHGTAFSLLFKKDFYVLGDNNENIRMKNFLCELSLDKRIIPIDGDIDIEDHIDYNMVYKRLKEMIDYSKLFLRDALT